MFENSYSHTVLHDVTLVKDQCRLDIRKYSFSQRAINECNKLSTDYVTASSSTFKNKTDKYLIRTGEIDDTELRPVRLPCPLAMWVCCLGWQSC